jgi:transcriptional regulator with XRE-family HTH domain
VVARSYVTNLRKGRIENPGYEKMLAIAKAMGFLPEAWFDETPADGTRAAPVEGRNLAARVGHLFEAVVHPRTGQPYTDAEVARLSPGGLTEEEVEGIRTDTLSDPTVGQIAALAAAFGVEPSYLVDRKEPPSLDEELLEGLSDETTREITREAMRLPERERGIVLGIVRQFGEQGSPPSGQGAASWPRDDPEGG